MADDVPPNSLTAPAKARSKRAGDVPEAVRRQYFVDGRGGPGLGFYADATVLKPAFRDHGARLVAERSDPRTVRDLTAIAQHRGWSVVVARGSRSFRREAWLNGQAIGLEVRGYRPTERDIQALDRRIDRGRAPTPPAPSRNARPSHRLEGRDQDGPLANEAVRARLRIVDAVVRHRVAAQPAQERILQSARARIATWLERGARLEPLSIETPPIVVSAQKPRERQR